MAFKFRPAETYSVCVFVCVYTQSGQLVLSLIKDEQGKQAGGPHIVFRLITYLWPLPYLFPQNSIKCTTLVKWFAWEKKLYKRYYSSEY